MRIYIAAPLFNEIEKTRNVRLRNLLKSLGHDTYLPQEDGGIAFDLLKNDKDALKIRKNIFENDINEIRKCDLMFCVLDGRVPDEGTCIEVGMAYALGKRCVGYKTDQRSLDKYGDNLMIEGCLGKIMNSEEEIKIFL
jgi:nucleoside 2-deoxyribosyltransferase